MKIYNTEDLAEILDLHVVTVRRMIKEGDIKGKKVGRKWIVTENQLQRYLEDEQD